MHKHQKTKIPAGLRRTLRFFTAKKHRWWLVASAGGLVTITLLVTGLKATEASVHSSLINEPIVAINQQVTIRLHQDLHVAPAQVKLTPADAFSYHFTAASLGETDLVITPKHNFKNNQAYSLAITNLQRLLSRRPVPAQKITFRTELAPGIASFTPGNSQVTRDASFTLVASDHQKALRGYSLALEPKADLQASFDGKSTWRWKPKKPLLQGVQYHVVLSTRQKPLQQTTLQVVSEPKIVNATAKDHFYPGDKITVTFDKPMKTDQPSIANFSALPGKGEWQNPTTYIFTPDKLDPNKSYDYSFKAGFASKDGGVIEADKKYTIATPGPATITGATPHGSNLKRTIPISFTFDQPVDHASAEAHFSIEPATKGSFRWQDNTLTFTPTGLDYQTTYTAAINPGVSATYGVPGTARATVSFSTELETLKLPVPAFRQSLKLSCEAAALRMALAYYGVQSSDFDLVQRMGYSPRGYSNGEWDDPYTQFVGDVNGRQWDKSGYGAYAPPVAAAARSMGRSASAVSGVGAGFIAQQIHDGHPVVVWGYEYTPTAFSWHTPSGKEIQAWQGEHTRTVIGVVGNANAPAGFYVTDPSSGGTKYWSAGSLMAQLNVRGGISNQAVVVY